MRINQGQDFVIGGYTPTPGSFDALIFGYYDGDQLLYVGRAIASRLVPGWTS
jgi:ATP-dependent DNA ligase